MTSGAILDQAVTAVDAAVDQLLQLLADRALAGESTEASLRFGGWFEQLRNRLAQVDHHLVVDLESKDAAQQRMCRNTAHLLADRLRITRGEARRRVEAAAVLADHDRMSGGVQPARYPVLAAGQADGEVSPEQVKVVLGCLGDVEKLVGLGSVTATDVAEVEKTLTGQAAVFDPNALSRCAARILECLDPDGTPDREQAQERLRRLRLHRVHGGMWRITGDLLPGTGAALAAVLRPLAAPRPDNPAEGRLQESDPRDADQRLHDALDEAAHRLLACGGLPATGGTPATIIVTIRLEDLLNRTGQATTSDGTDLSVAAALRMADEAEVIPTVLNDAGGILAVGRSRRIATRTQTLALYARDGGCSFPGCDHPPEWCDRHHIVAWVDGGRTDLDNLTLLCSYHHHRFEQHGWTCRLIDGLPHWIPPVWLDPGQRPQLHQRFRRKCGSNENPGTIGTDDLAAVG